MKRAVVLLGVLLGVLVASSLYRGGFRSASGPVPIRTLPLGRVTLYQSAGERPEPRYQVGQPLRLLFEPARPEARQCDPFAGGTLELTLSDPEGRQPLELELPLLQPWVVHVADGWLMRAVPAAVRPIRGGRLEPFLLPDLPGRWRLELTWRCRNGQLRREFHSFRVHRDRRTAPETAAFWNRLAGIDREPASAQVRRYKQARDEAVDLETKMWVLSELFQALKKAGDYGEAEKVATSWAAATGPAGFPAEEARAWNGAHEAARLRGDIRKAFEYLERSLAVLDRLGFHNWQHPNNLYSRGLLLEQSGRLLQALEAYAAAKAIAARMEYDTIRALAEQKELNLLLQLGHHQLVNRRLAESLPFWGSTDPGVVNNTGWLILRGLEGGVSFGGLQATALERARQAFEQSLAAFRAAANEPEEGNVLANLAEVAWWRSDPAAARRLLEEARAKANPSHRSLQLSFSWMEGNLALLEARYDAALLTFQALEAEAGSTFENLYTRRAPLDRAEADGQFESQYAGRAAFGQGEVFSARGDLEAAQQAYDRAISWIEKDSAIRSPLHAAAMLSKWALWEARAVQVRLSRGLDLEALEVVERGAWKRRRSLARAPDDAGTPGPEAETIRRMRERLEALDREIARFDLLPPTPENDRQRRQLLQERQNLWAELGMSIGGPDLREAPPLRRADAISAVPPGGLLLRFAVLPDELVVWEATSSDLRVRRVPLPRAELEQKIEAFAASCQRGTPDLETGRFLSRRLLGDRAGALPGTIVLVHEGVLRHLPWAALPVDGRPLLEHAVLVHLPLLRWRLPERPAPDPAATDRVVIASDPARDLPWALEEGRQVNGRFERSTTLLERKQATRAALVQNLPSSWLFHYAGHGATDPLNPYLSHLRLAGNSRLTLMDLQDLRLRGPLVFLNACAAGQVSREGGGALGLADGFFAAGASAVIASLWDVPDDAGLKLSSLFYDRLLADPARSPARAMTDALRMLARGGSKAGASSPAVWSSYFVLGTADAQARPPLETASTLSGSTSR